MNDDITTITQISLGMVNVFLIKGKRSILVDTGTPNSERKILEKLSSLGVKPHDISLILLTHCHSDHFGSVAALKDLTGARVAIHQSEAEALRQGVNVDIVPTGGLGRFFKLLVSGTTQFPPVEPDILIEQELSLDEFGGEGKVISTPGHTSGSMSVMLANKETIIGDLLMGSFIRKNVPNYPWFAYDMKQLKKSIGIVMEHHPKKIYASHGGPFTSEAILQRFKHDLR